MRIGLCLVFFLFTSSIQAAEFYTRYFEGAEDNNRAEITLSKQGNKIQISGFSLWVSSNNSPHTGEFEGHVILKENAEGHFNQGECQFTINYTLDELIITEDNYQCGGMNVTFNGLYKRK